LTIVAWANQNGVFSRAVEINAEEDGIDIVPQVLACGMAQFGLMPPSREQQGQTCAQGTITEQFIYLVNRIKYEGEPVVKSVK
jgi:hypothetical protein